MARSEIASSLAVVPFCGTQLELKLHMFWSNVVAVSTVGADNVVFAGVVQSTCMRRIM